MMKVLVADDHPLFREAIVGALQGMDEDVGVIESGSISEAFDQVAGHEDLDLILLDMRMPGMSGVKGIRALRVRRPDVPIAVISALTDSFVVRECLDAGAIGYISKSLPRARTRPNPRCPPRRAGRPAREPGRPARLRPCG